MPSSIAVDHTRCRYFFITAKANRRMSVARPLLQTCREVLWSGVRRKPLLLTFAKKKPGFVCDVARTKFRRLADVPTAQQSARDSMFCCFRGRPSDSSGGASKLIEACQSSRRLYCICTCCYAFWIVFGDSVLVISTRSHSLWEVLL